MKNRTKKYFIDNNNIIHKISVHGAAFTQQENTPYTNFDELKQYVRDTFVSAQCWYNVCSCCRPEVRVQVKEIQQNLQVAQIQNQIKQMINQIVQSASNSDVTSYWDTQFDLLHLHYGFEDWLVEIHVTKNLANKITLWHRNNVKYKEDCGHFPGYHKQWKKCVDANYVIAYIKQHTTDKGLLNKTM